MIKRAGVLSKARAHSADIELMVSDFDIDTSPTANSDGINTPDISSIREPIVGLKEATDRYQKKSLRKRSTLTRETGQQRLAN